MVALRMSTSCPQPLSSHSHERGSGDRYLTAALGTLRCNVTPHSNDLTAVEGDVMTQPTPATRPTLTDLLAGVIDLGTGATPPHGPGPCTALCVPACAGESAGAAPESTREALAAQA